MDIEQQKQVADDVLKKLEILDPTCIIAGGAPRDWSFGNLASDLDCYFYWRPDLQTWHVIQMLEMVGLPTTRREFNTSGQYEYHRNPMLQGVFEGVVSDVKIQLMWMNKPTFKSVIPEFALDICKVWYKGGTVHTTKDFDDAVTHKIIRIQNKLYGNQDAYVQKIVNKFPDFMLFS